MAEDLGEEWWETKTKNSKNDKIEDEGMFFVIFVELKRVAYVDRLLLILQES